jgi:hypothetical protein
MSLSYDQTEAAKELDPFNLPEGTFVSWKESKGWGGGSTTRYGTIVKRTEKSYVTLTDLGGNARIDRAEPGRRRLRALRTPEEHQAAISEAKTMRATQKAEAAERSRQDAEKQRIRDAHRVAAERLRAAHGNEYDTYVEEALSG